MFFGLDSFVLIDVEAVDLMSLVGKVDGHGESHFSESDKSNLSKRVELPCNELHKCKYLNKINS